MTEVGSRSVWWAVLLVVCMLLSWWAFRGYLTPDALIEFANWKLC